MTPRKEVIRKYWTQSRAEGRPDIIGVTVTAASHVLSSSAVTAISYLGVGTTPVSFYLLFVFVALLHLRDFLLTRSDYWNKVHSSSPAS